MSGLNIFFVLLISALIIGFIVIRRFSRQGSKVSSGRILRFAESSAKEVLQTNWDKDDYYAILYTFASNDLGEHMRKNRNLLTRVLEERANLLGDFVSIENLEVSGGSFTLIPSQTSEVVGTLRCTKGSVPVTVLLNTSGETLALDGIKIKKDSVMKNINE